MEKFKLTDDNLQNLEAFKSILNKDENTIINEALGLYFKDEAEKLQALKDSQTNLSYDEFWDDVDI